MYSNYTKGYGSEAELANIELYHGYSECLLKFAFAFYVIFIIIGIPGNLITIIALGCCKKYRNATAFFIISLHTNDLLFCCLILPISAANYNVRHWIFGSTACNIYALIKYGLAVTERFIVMAITINRYIMVCHPLLYSRLYRGKSLIVCLMSTWVVGFIIPLPSFFGIWGDFGIDSRGIACVLIPDKNDNSPKILLTCLVFVCPYLIISICYGCIWWTVKKKAIKSRNYNISTLQLSISTTETSDMNQREPVTISATSNDDHEHNSSMKLTTNRAKRLTKKENRLHLPTRKDEKLATIIIAICISFAACHFPMMLTRAICGEQSTKPTLHVIVHLLESCTFCINPIFYVVMSKEYRQAYKSLFRNMKSNLTGLFKSSNSKNLY